MKLLKAVIGNVFLYGGERVSRLRRASVGDEVLTASPARVEAIGETAESGDRQCVPLW